MASMLKVPVTSILGLVPLFISLGRCVCCIEFRCGTIGIHCGCSTCPEGDFALIMRSMSNSESRYDSEPDAFDGDSSDDRKDTEVEIVGERVGSVPAHGRGKGLITGQEIPLIVVSYGFQSANTS
ncbi:unnamed protein product [Prunus brigantina]